MFSIVLGETEIESLGFIFILHSGFLHGRHASDPNSCWLHKVTSANSITNGFSPYLVYTYRYLEVQI